MLEGVVRGPHWPWKSPDEIREIRAGNAPPMPTSPRQPNGKAHSREVIQQCHQLWDQGLMPMAIAQMVSTKEHPLSNKSVSRMAACHGFSLRPRKRKEEPPQEYQDAA